MRRYAFFGCGLLVATFATDTVAAQIAWTFTGTATARFDPITDDPVADLLGASRSSFDDVALSLRFVIDTAAPRTILQNDSTLQRVVYEDAIVGAELTLNGVSFATLRAPGAFSFGDSNESEIRVHDAVAPGASDELSLSLDVEPFPHPDASPLFQTYTLPFNAIVEGIPVTSATVGPEFVRVHIRGPGMFSNTDLPVADGAFDDATFATIGAALLSDLGLGLSNGGIGLELHEVNFEASPVPLPGAAALLASALAVLIGRRRRAPG